MSTCEETIQTIHNYVFFRSGICRRLFYFLIELFATIIIFDDIHFHLLFHTVETLIVYCSVIILPFILVARFFLQITMKQRRQSCTFNSKNDENNIDKSKSTRFRSIVVSGATVSITRCNEQFGSDRRHQGMHNILQ